MMGVLMMPGASGSAGQFVEERAGRDDWLSGDDDAGTTMKPDGKEELAGKIGRAYGSDTMSEFKNQCLHSKMQNLCIQRGEEGHAMLMLAGFSTEVTNVMELLQPFQYQWHPTSMPMQMSSLATEAITIPNSNGAGNFLNTAFYQANPSLPSGTSINPTITASQKSFQYGQVLIAITNISRPGQDFLSIIVQIELWKSLNSRQ